AAGIHRAGLGGAARPGAVAGIARRHDLAGRGNRRGQRPVPDAPRARGAGTTGAQPRAGRLSPQGPWLPPPVDTGSHAWKTGPEGPVSLRAVATRVAHRSEACADAHAEHDRVEFGLAGLDAVDLHVRVRLEVARIGAGEPGRGDVDVQADGGHGALGGFDADALAGGRGALAVVVGLVVAEADEGAQRAVGRAEAVLATERVGLRLGTA